VPLAASWVRCGGKSEMRRNDSGKARSDRRARGTVYRPRKTCPFHARSKFAAHPSCRTSRNAHTRHIRPEWPRQSTANRRLGTSTGAVLPGWRHSPSRCACEICEDCHCDKRDKASSCYPWKSAQRIMKAYSISKFHLRNVATTCTMAQEEHNGRLHIRACARGN